MKNLDNIPKNLDKILKKRFFYLKRVFWRCFINKTINEEV